MERPEALFWNVPAEATQSQLEALPAGLSEREARQRSARFGPNTLRNYGERPLILQYLSHFKNPLVMVLLAASAVSALTGDGIPQLREAILEAIAPAGAFEQEAGFITSVRHERLLREAVEWLEKARDATESGIPHEMLLLDLYAALQPIDAITGATTADVILNRIFSTFCIGK